MEYWRGFSLVDYFKLLDWSRMFKCECSYVGYEDFGTITYIGPKIFLLSLVSETAIMYPTENRTFNSIKNPQISGGTSLYFPIKRVGVYNGEQNKGN